VHILVMNYININPKHKKKKKKKEKEKNNLKKLINIGIEFNI